MTFQRLDIGKAMEDARLHLQAQLLRDAFHGTLSHELCSPLAAIRGSASVLDSIPAIRASDQMHSLVEAISDEAAELDGFIQNLLNATRVTAGGVSPRLEWADPRDIVNAAIKQRARRLTAHEVRVAFSDDLPLIMWIPVWFRNRVGSFWKMRRSIRRPAQRSQSIHAPTMGTSCCRLPIKASGSRWTNSNSLAASRSEASAIGPQSPDLAWDFGSHRPSSGPMAAPSTFRARDMDWEQRRPLSCQVLW